jgi:hypothetical protein
MSPKLVEATEKLNRDITKAEKEFVDVFIEEVKKRLRKCRKNTYVLVAGMGVHFITVNGKIPHTAPEEQAIPKSLQEILYVFDDHSFLEKYISEIKLD